MSDRDRPDHLVGADRRPGGAGTAGVPAPPSRAGETGLVRILGTRRELVAWLLTAAAALVEVGRVVEQFAYPVGLGLRFNAVAVGPTVAGVEVLVLLVAAAVLAVAADATAKSRLIVLIDLLVLAVAVVAALAAVVLTFAAYRFSGVPGIVTGSVLAQLGDLVAVGVAGLVIRRALALTPRPVRRAREAGSGAGPSVVRSPAGPDPFLRPGPPFPQRPWSGPAGYGPAPQGFAPPGPAGFGPARPGPVPFGPSRPGPDPYGQAPAGQALSGPAPYGPASYSGPGPRRPAPGAPWPPGGRAAGGTHPEDGQVGADHG